MSGSDLDLMIQRGHSQRHPAASGDSLRSMIEIPMRPFQYPSLEHLDAAVDAAVQRNLQLRRVRDSTAKWARDSYRIFRRFLVNRAMDVRFLGGDLQLQVKILEDWIASMGERGLQRGAVSAAWRGLASIFRWITRTENVVNPLRFVDPPRLGRRFPRFLPKSAAEQVLTFVEHHLWASDFERARNTALIGVMLLAGLRRGEVLRLRSGDVDLAHASILLRESKGPNGGKDRIAYMPPQLGAMLGRYIEHRRAHPRAKHEYLFVTAGKGNPMSRWVIDSVCQAIKVNTGIHVSPHMLRHSYATLLRQAAVPDRIAMELLGHSDLRMLLRYSHVEAHEPRDAANRLTLNI
jgi:integrase/recombinase XerC